MRVITNRSVLYRVVCARRPDHSRFLSTIGTCKTDNELFPWKSVPQRRTFFENCSALFRVLSAHLAYGRYTKQDEEDRKELYHTISGSLWALKTTVAAIFQNKSMLEHFNSLKAKNSLRFEGPLTSPDVQSINFREIFDEKLAEFYTKAIDKHCAQTKNMVVYSLLKVYGAQLVEMELMANIQRGGQMPKYDRVIVESGVTMFLPPIETDSDVDEYEEEIAEQYLTARRNSTVRTKVLVHCSEIFAITDADSGTVVQGSLEPRRVSHQIIFENYIDVHKDRLGGSWMIVDIDNWLKGNEFWTSRKIPEVVKVE